ncbi:type IV secretion system DNA-binding domain-containing protein [Marinobacter alexandrii]|uniref:type IV secretion system DNA-binding domain-containing protein n=1 Tax=Marinobacter alexandrii TaxID=2570351 RepID=UPI0032641360
MSDEGKQYWGVIFISTGITSIVIYSLIAFWTWGVFTDWPSVDKHLKVFLKITSEYFSGSTLALNGYYEYLHSNGFLLDFWLHALIPAMIAIPLGFYISYKIIYVEGGVEDHQHKSGPRLYVGNRAISHSKSCLNKEVSRREGARGLRLHPGIAISAEGEVGNLFVYGQQGSGKSVVIKPIVEQIIDRQDKVLIYDQKREYTALFGGKNAVLVSPTDKRGFVWDIGKDVETPEQAKLFADCLIESRGGEEFWFQGARIILTGCVIAAIRQSEHWGWADLRDVLDKPIAEIKRLFERYYPEGVKLVEEDSKTTQGFMTIIGSQLAWISDLSKLWPKDSKRRFSVRSWVNNKSAKKVLLIANDPLNSAVSAPLCNAIVTLSTRHVLSLGDSARRRIWFCLDELGNLPRCDALLQLMSLGRSKGACVVAGTQSTSQLVTIYGESQTETLLTLFANIICLRLGASGKSASRAGESFGRRTIVENVSNIDNAGNKSISNQQKDIPLVTREEIVHLSATKKGVSGFMSIAGWGAVYRLVWPFHRLEKKYPEYVPVDRRPRSTGKRQKVRSKHKRSGVC